LGGLDKIDARGGPPDRVSQPGAPDLLTENGVGAAVGEIWKGLDAYLVRCDTERPH